LYRLCLNSDFEANRDLGKPAAKFFEQKSQPAIDFVGVGKIAAIGTLKKQTGRVLKVPANPTFAVEGRFRLISRHPRLEAFSCQHRPLPERL
jgi:hypothetical protein